MLRPGIVVLCVSAFVCLTVWIGFFFQPIHFETHPLAELAGTWESCVPASGDPAAEAACTWHRESLPGELTQATKQAMEHWVLLRRDVSIPSECAKQACVLLAGQVSDVAAFSLDGQALGGRALFPPALSPRRLHPVAVPIPASFAGATAKLEAKFWVHYPRRSGFQRAPLQIVTQEDAKVFVRGHTFTLIFLPMASALGLVLIVGMVAGFSVPKPRTDVSLLAFAIFCLSGAVFLTSFADVSYDLHPMRVAIPLRLIAKRTYDCAFFAFILTFFDWPTRSRQFLRVAFCIVATGCAIGCFLCVWDAWRAPSDFAAAVANSQVLFHLWRSKHSGAVAGVVASLLMARTPGWLGRLAAFTALNALLYYDSLVFFELPIGDYGSKFYFVGLAALFAGLMVRRDAQQESEARARAAADVELGRATKQIAHDIRSPLAALNMQLEAVGALPEEPRNMIRSAARRINDIANLLLVRNEEPQGSRRQSAALANTIDRLVAEGRARHRARLSTEILFDLNASNYHLFVHVDIHALRRAFANLLNNAVEALEDGGTVRVKIAATDDEVTLSVMDTGRGIPPELLDSLGQRGLTVGKAGGSGLGLHQAKTFVESHGGSLKLVSELGRGTDVSLCLPRADPPPWFASSLVLQRQQTVVIVDDDANIHQVWRQRFAGTGVPLLHFANPAEVLARATWPKHVFHLVDYEFIGARQTGTDLVAQLRTRGPCLLVTSHAEEASVQESAQRLGVRLVPKNVASVIPLQVDEGAAAWDAVLLDDDSLIHAAWRMNASAAGKKLRIFHTADELFAALSQIAKHTPIYVDFNLLGSTGEEVTRTLVDRGYASTYLVTGERAADLPPMPWLKGVLSKTAPVAL